MNQVIKANIKRKSAESCIHWTDLNQMKLA